MVSVDPSARKPRTAPGPRSAHEYQAVLCLVRGLPQRVTEERAGAPAGDLAGAVDTVLGHRRDAPMDIRW